MSNAETSNLHVAPPMVSRTAWNATATLGQVAKALRSVQLPVIGLALVMLHDGTGTAAARTIAIGLFLTLLTRLFDRLWPAASAGGRQRILVRAVCAAANTTLAFAAAAGFSILADGHWHATALLWPWWLTATLLAAALEVAISDRTRIVVAGDTPAAAQLARSITAAGRGLVAVIDPTSQDDLDRLDRLTRGAEMCTVIIPADTSAVSLNRLCGRLYDTNVHVRTTLLCGTTSGVAIAPMMDLLPPPITGVTWAAKRGFDLMLAIALILFLAPLLLLTALAIRLDSPGPILFRQLRFGQGSRPVLIYKFRTMRIEAADASGAARTIARDPRVTPFGRVLRRLSIDELPQLLNVVRGEMSLVGPRPHALHMKVEGQFYHDAVDTYRARHRMLPGITGWAQINGSRGEVDTMEKARRRVELDLWYIANWSPLLDLWILARTLVGGFATLRAD